VIFTLPIAPMIRSACALMFRPVIRDLTSAGRFACQSRTTASTVVSRRATVPVVFLSRLRSSSFSLASVLVAPLTLRRSRLCVSGSRPMSTTPVHTPCWRHRTARRRHGRAALLISASSASFLILVCFFEAALDEPQQLGMD